MFKTHLVHISDEALHDGLAERVVLPGVLGDFEIAECHAPIVSLLAGGYIWVYGGRMDKTAQTSFMVEQGLMRFDGKELYVVVE